MNATISTPRPLAPIGQRRFWVVLSYGWYLVCLSAAIIGTVTHLAFLLKWSALAPLCILGLLMLAPQRLGLPDLRLTALDERQRERVTWAYAASFRGISLVLVLLGTGLALLTTDARPVWSTPESWTGLLVATLTIVNKLPAALLAWTEPDYCD